MDHADILSGQTSMFLYEIPLREDSGIKTEGDAQGWGSGAWGVSTHRVQVPLWEIKRLCAWWWLRSSVVSFMALNYPYT